MSGLSKTSCSTNPHRGIGKIWTGPESRGVMLGHCSFGAGLAEAAPIPNLTAAIPNSTAALYVTLRHVTLGKFSR